MKTRLLALVVPALVLCSLPGSSQDLTIFRDDGNGRGQAPQGAVAELAAAFTAPAAPTMILKGVYRFGDTYHVSLQTTEGATYRATWQAGQQNGTSVANGYQIANVDERAVTLGLPAGVTCQQNLQSGNSCVGRNQVALSFAETEPVSNGRGRGRGNNNNNNNNNNLPAFIQNNGNNDQAAQQAAQLRAIVEAARNGDQRAEQLIEAIGNRGRGNNNGGGGGGGGRGGRGGFGGRGGNNNDDD